MKANSKKWLLVLIGGMADFLLCGIVIFMVMPSLMIVTAECNMNFDQTIAALQKRITQQGWVVSDITDMNKSMNKHGVEFGPRVTLVKLCKPEYAKSVLETNRYVSTMMPCSLSVWEGDDGNVYVSKMNLGLMAKMFGGNVDEAIGIAGRFGIQAIPTLILFKDGNEV